MRIASIVAALGLLSGLAGIASAQQTARLYIETDAPGGIVSAGQTVHMRVMVDWTGGVQFAGHRFRIDVENNAGQASNFTSIFPPIFFSVGPVSGGSVRDVDLATLAPFYLGGYFVPPFNLPTLPLVEYDWVAPNLPHGTQIDVTMAADGGRLGAYIFTTPASAHWVAAATTYDPYTFTMAPAPGGGAVLVAAAGVLSRRRR